MSEVSVRGSVSMWMCWVWEVMMGVVSVEEL